MSLLLVSAIWCNLVACLWPIGCGTVFCHSLYFAIAVPRQSPAQRIEGARAYACPSPSEATGGGPKIGAVAHASPLITHHVPLVTLQPCNPQLCNLAPSVYSVSSVDRLPSHHYPPCTTHFRSAFIYAPSPPRFSAPSASFVVQSHPCHLCSSVARRPL